MGIGITSDTLMGISAFSTSVMDSMMSNEPLFTGAGYQPSDKTVHAINELTIPLQVNSLLDDKLFYYREDYNTVFWQPLMRAPEVRFARAALAAAANEVETCFDLDSNVGLHTEARRLAQFAEFDALAHFSTGYLTRMIFSAFQAAGFAVQSQRLGERFMSDQRDTAIRALYLLKGSTPLTSALALEEAYHGIGYFNDRLAAIGASPKYGAPSDPFFPSGIHSMMELIEINRQIPFSSCLKDYVLRAFPARTTESETAQFDLIRGRKAGWEKIALDHLHSQHAAEDFTSLILGGAIMAWTNAAVNVPQFAVQAATRAFKLALLTEDQKLSKDAAEAVLTTYAKKPKQQTLARIALLEQPNKLPAAFVAAQLKLIADDPNFKHADKAKKCLDAMIAAGIA